MFFHKGVRWEPYFLKGLKNDNFHSLCDELSGKNLMLRFCKHVRGVNRKSNNPAVRLVCFHFRFMCRNFVLATFWCPKTLLTSYIFLGKKFTQEKRIERYTAPLYQGYVFEKAEEEWRNPTPHVTMYMAKFLSWFVREIYANEWLTQIRPSEGSSKSGWV